MQSVGSISVSLSAIQKEFDATLAAVQWIGLMGSIMLCSLSLCFGRAGDLIGRRTIFKTGLTLYTAGAGLAAFSGTFLQLLASRCVMALGLAMAAPMAAAIIASAHGHEHRGRALGLLAASIALGRTTGPTNRRGHSSALGLESSVSCQLYFWGSHLCDYVFNR